MTAPLTPEAVEWLALSGEGADARARADSIADAAERLRRERDTARAEVERLMAALEPFASRVDGLERYQDDTFLADVTHRGPDLLTVGDLRRAREALGRKA